MDSKAPTPYSARKSYFLGLEYLLHEPKKRFSQIHKQFESRGSTKYKVSLFYFFLFSY